MNLTELNRKFNTRLKCLNYLGKMRWGKNVTCAYCGSEETRPLKSEAGRYNCRNCKRNFSVTIDTIYQDSRLSLPKWFQVIALMLNAKKGISAKEIMRNVNVSYKTAWYACMRVRCAMIDNCEELQNIVEMDEAYTGGKPRKKYPNDPSNPSISTITNKRGRGTKKVPVVGIVERDGKIVLKVIEKLTGRNLLSMLKDNVKTDNAIVITDDFSSYKKFDKEVEHLVIDHKKEFSKGIVNTNTIEGFWAILKNSIRGQYVALSKKYLPFYLVQAQYIYNHRNYKGNLFQKYIKASVSDEKCLLYYKPKGDVKKLVYNRNKCN
jgi:transposase-like protein